MYSFRNDYSEGAHPVVLQALTETNLKQTSGYGTDDYCAEAAQLIRDLCQAPNADVHFLVGGTQTNLLVITSFLASYEAVIAAHTGHVNVHETGAIEATGHKVCTAYAPDGKLTPALVESIVNAHSSEHMVAPKMVYISDSTEIGTLYTKAELVALRECCNKHGLLLFLDGARLGSAFLPRERSDSARSGRSDRYVLHRRHQERRYVRRGSGSEHPPRPLPLAHQAARRHAGQGPSAGRTVQGSADR